VIAAGYVRFMELASIAIAAPAVGGEPIVRHAARYYTRPMESARNVWTYVVLQVAAPASAGNSIESRRLPSSGNDAHRRLVHALRLHTRPDDRTQPPADDNVASLGQVVSTSVITEGELALFPVTRVDDCRLGG
jgi:hypothetical protein